MKAKLKNLYDPDIEDLATYKPHDEENFCLLFRAMVGINGEEGEESFDIQVCTPQWFLSTFQKNDIIIVRHHLIVFEYNFERIREKIERFINTCSGTTWDEIALKIAELGHWEFENYDE